ncbi:MAG: glutathione S-transferase family protein [Pseudomonadota bacterium]
MTAAPRLIGKFLSPYVRRVGITLTHYGVPFERLILSAIDDEAERRRHNPTGRVPALILPDGDTLIDSAAIIDHFDERAGALALTPREGSARRHDLLRIAVATGTIDKLMAANAERRRPPDRQMADRLAALHEAALGGFADMERALAGRPWFAQQMRQGDLTSAVALTFADHIFPELVDHTEVPTLHAMRLTCEASDAFAACAID